MPDPEIKPEDKAPENAATQKVDDVLPPPVGAPDVTETPVAKTRKIGFLPIFLGGVVAAALGYGAAFMGYGTAYSPLAQRLAALEATLAAQPDVSGQVDALAQNVAAQIAQGQSDVAPQIAAALAPLQDQLSSLSTRIAEVGDVTSDQSGGDVSALQQQLTELRATLDQQGAALQEVAQTRAAEASAAGQSAIAAANAAADEARAQLLAALQARLQTALDAGTGFATALDDLQAQGGTVPAALADIPTDGVATLAQLQDDFIPAARAALVAERGNENGLMGFLQNRFNPRSVAPRAGDDSDAILSRAGAAVAAGDLTTAVAEISGLSGAAQSEMASWLTKAQVRLAAEAAIKTLNTAE